MLQYRVVEKTWHEVKCTVILQTFAVESRGFRKNAHKLIDKF